MRYYGDGDGDGGDGGGGIMVMVMVMGLVRYYNHWRYLCEFTGYLIFR